jgi:Holliday junction resolvase RusA-like endonuclease
MEKAGATVTDKPVKAMINAYFEIPKSYTKKKVQAIINGEIKPAKPDLVNIIKSQLDGCNKIIFKDDVQIYAISATKSYITNLEKYGVYCCFEWED